MANINPKVRKVIEVLLPSYQTDIFARVIEKDPHFESSKPTNARLLRTPWPTKMRDAFKLTYGRFNLKQSLKDSWKQWSKAGLLPPNIADMGSFGNPFTALRDYHRKFKDEEFTTANISDPLLAPFDLTHSLFNLIGSYTTFLVTLPLQLLMMLFLKLQTFLENKSYNKAAKVFDIAAMIIGFVPLIILSGAFQLLNSVFLIARECIKFTPSIVINVASTPIVSLVALLASIKAYPKLKLARGLPMTQYRPVRQVSNAKMHDQEPAPETHKQKLQNTRDVLSVLRRENFAYRIGLNNEIEIFDSRVPGTTRYTVSAQDAKDNPKKLSAYYQLNLLSTMTAESQKDLLDFCADNEIELQTSGRIGAPDSLNTPLL